MRECWPWLNNVKNSLNYKMDYWQRRLLFEVDVPVCESLAIHVLGKILSLCINFLYVHSSINSEFFHLSTKCIIHKLISMYALSLSFRKYFCRAYFIYIQRAYFPFFQCIEFCLRLQWYCFYQLWWRILRDALWQISWWTLTKKMILFVVC